MKPVINYDAYPFGRTEPVPTPYVYAFIRGQISYVKGKYLIECPQCRDEGVAVVSEETNAWYDAGSRDVHIGCTHCNTSVSFTWVNPAKIGR